MQKKIIIIIPFALPWQRHSHCERQTALILAKKGFKVIAYMHPDAHFFLKKSKVAYPRIKNIFFYKPSYLLPFKRFPVVERINQFLTMKYLKLKYVKKPKTVLWIFNHKFYFFPKVLNTNQIDLFDCVEYPSSLDSQMNISIRKQEEELIRNTSYFFVDSPTLFAKWKRYNPILAPQGYEPLKLKNGDKTIDIEKKLPKKKPIIGYVGNINYRMDFPLIHQLIRSNPRWTFLFVGNVQYFPSEDKYIHTNKWIKKLHKLDNFYRLPEQNKDSLARLVSLCKVCLIPYNTQIKFNYFSRALKIYDYFIFHKPIVSTPTLESKRLKKIIAVRNSAEGFEKSILKYIENPQDKKVIKIQNKLCLNNTWDKKVQFILKNLNLI